MQLGRLLNPLKRDMHSSDCKQVRQQSVEEVNQRWAAKSHGLLSRISNLERQLQGQSPDSPSAASPSAQVCPAVNTQL